MAPDREPGRCRAWGRAPPEQPGRGGRELRDSCARWRGAQKESSGPEPGLADQALVRHGRAAPPTGGLRGDRWPAAALGRCGWGVRGPVVALPSCQAGAGAEGKAAQAGETLAPPWRRGGPGVPKQPPDTQLQPDPGLTPKCGLPGPPREAGAEPRDRCVCSFPSPPPRPRALLDWLPPGTQPACLSVSGPAP